MRRVARASDAEIAIMAAKEASRVLLEREGAPHERIFKGGGDFATEADVAAERAALALLRECRPDDAVIAEESGWSGPREAERVWMLDPLCGTLNYASRTGPYGVNVALTKGDEVLAAAVSEPLYDRVIWTDGSAVLIGCGDEEVPASPSPESRVVEILMDAQDPDARGFSLARFWRSSAFDTLNPRYVGTGISLAWVAAGLRAGFVIAGDRAASVHFSAGIGLCRAAGCIMSGLLGEDLHLANSGIVCAADERTYEALMSGIGEQFQSARLDPPVR